MGREGLEIERGRRHGGGEEGGGEEGVGDDEENWGGEEEQRYQHRDEDKQGFDPPGNRQRRPAERFLIFGESHISVVAGSECVVCDEGGERE